MMNAVGGTSIHYWAQSWRLKPWDFQTRSESIRRYGPSSIPKGSTLEDWPITYDELEPYYDTIEWEVGVSGKAGNIQGKIDPRGNIFEGPRQREYPMPPLRSTEFIDHMFDAANASGLASVPPARGDQHRSVAIIVPAAPTTAFALRAGVTSTLNVPPPSPLFPRRSKPRT